VVREFSISHDILALETIFCNHLSLLLISQLMKQQKLTEELLEDASVRSILAVGTLLFQHLAPLLVLRVFPRRLFGSALRKSSNAPLQSQLVDLLLEQIVDPLEFKEVKMMAVEILAKVPIEKVLPLVLRQLQVFLKEHEPAQPLLCLSTHIPPILMGINARAPECGFVTAKLLVYYLNRIATESDLETTNAIWNLKANN
jgi:hypothetical protein